MRAASLSRPVVAVAAIAGAGALAAGAVAFGPGAPDPAHNLRAGRMPAACRTHPTGAVCVNAAVWYLDRDRAAMGKPPYALPANFVALGAARQALILTNLDRIAFRLPPVAGLTAVRNTDARAGARAGRDPVPSGALWQAYTSNAAFGYPNMPAAYQAWLYDDGLGSGNVDCTTARRSGCWGHRRDVLWNFAQSGQRAPVLTMGAVQLRTAETMLITARYSGGVPRLAYSWAQARAAGAGRHVYRVSAPR
jgi:hypothetical protein